MGIFSWARYPFISVCVKEREGGGRTHGKASVVLVRVNSIAVAPDAHMPALGRGLVVLQPLHVLYRGPSLIRKHTPLGHYYTPKPRVLGVS